MKLCFTRSCYTFNAKKVTFPLFFHQNYVSAKFRVRMKSDFNNETKVCVARMKMREEARTEDEFLRSTKENETKTVVP
jgi:hypothetical protein